jgi:hypothetical protein
MTPWGRRVSYSSTTLQYLSDIILNLSIQASGIVLVMLGLSSLRN